MSELPDEIYQLIFLSTADLRSLIVLSRVSKHFHQLISDSSFICNKLFRECGQNLQIELTFSALLRALRVCYRQTGWSQALAKFSANEFATRMEEIRLKGDQLQVRGEPYYCRVALKEHYVVLGDTGVGKTHLCCKATNYSAGKPPSPDSVDYFLLEGEILYAKQTREMYECIFQLEYRSDELTLESDHHNVILVYDPTRLETYQHVQTLADCIVRRMQPLYGPVFYVQSPSPLYPVTIVAARVDRTDTPAHPYNLDTDKSVHDWEPRVLLPRAVSWVEAATFADSHGMNYAEVSCSQAARDDSPEKLLELVKNMGRYVRLQREQWELDEAEKKKKATDCVLS